jgi:single-stranded DNA-specific DHH superfamily exonuclease
LDNWKTIIKESQPFLTQVLRDDSAFLLFHDDADGCCAAAVLLHTVSCEAAHGFIDFASPEKHSVELTPRVAGKLVEEKPKLIVSLDLALTSSASKIARLLESLDAHMLMYDHHVQSRSIEWPERCTHLNPLNFKLGNKPASCYSHVLYKHRTGKSDACWAAAVGVVADYRTEQCRRLIEEVRRSYPRLYPFKTVDQTTALKSPLMTMAHLVNAGYQHADHKGAKTAVKALNEALQTGDPAALLEGRTKRARILHRYRRDVDEELKKFLDQFDSEAELHLDQRLAFYFMEPRYNITSQTATQLQHGHRNTVIAIISPETPKTLKVSLRRGNKVKADLAALAESSITGLRQASGGGHPEAAGCVLRKEDLGTWKENVLKRLHQSLAQTK